MADCNKLFKKYYEEIDLTSTRMDSLRKARNAAEDRIKEHFKEVLKAKVPAFEEQGSFIIKTVVNPIEGEYDIDYGVYLNNLSDDASKWPSAETIHSWIIDAVKDYTDEPPKDKRTCVRLVYQGKPKYHIDLPIYAIYRGKVLLVKKDENPWPESDPRQFTDWFLKQVDTHGEQLRRNVQYLKAWQDYKSVELPSIAINILVGNHHQTIENRDDLSFATILSPIITHLETNRAVRKPVSPFENVLIKISKEKLYGIIVKLKKLQQDALEATLLPEDQLEQASKIWNRQFGDRFPVEEKDSKDGFLSVVSNSPIEIKSPPKAWSTV